MTTLPTREATPFGIISLTFGLTAISFAFTFIVNGKELIDGILGDHALFGIIPQFSIGDVLLKLDLFLGNKVKAPKFGLSNFFTFAWRFSAVVLVVSLRH